MARFLDTLWHLERVEEDKNFFVLYLQPTGSEPKIVVDVSMEHYAICQRWTFISTGFPVGDKILYSEYDEAFIRKFFEQGCKRLLPVHELTELD